MILTKISEDSKNITLGWTPPLGVGGYVFYANGEAVSTGSPNLKTGGPRKEVKFSKTKPGPPFIVAAVCRQAGILVMETGLYSEEQPPPPPPTGTPIRTVDFESGDFSGVVQQESSAGRISLVSGIPWGGSHTAKVLIGPPDKGVAGSGGSYRTELIPIPALQQIFGYPGLQGRHTWMTFDMLLDPNFQLSMDPNCWGLFMQYWTQGLEAGHPCCAITFNKGQMAITLRGGNAANSNERVIPVGAVPLDTLMRWKFHHLWASGSGGLVEVWLNGSKVVTDTSPNLSQGNDSSVETKFGVYRSGIDPPTRDSYTLVDNIAYWASDPG